MACSRAKIDNKGRIPAFIRYDGPTYRTLRSWARERGLEGMPPNLHVYIMSGKYGMLWYNTPIPWYDQKMSRSSAAALSRQVLTTLKAIKDNNEFGVQPRRIMFTGPEYPYGRMLTNIDKLFTHSTVTMNIARIGIQCHNLRAWLEEVEVAWP